MEKYEILIVCLALKACVWIGLLGCIIADLISGIRKAKVRGEFRSSSGFRRTVDKLTRYYGAMFAMLWLDAMHICVCWYLDNYWEYSIPCVPVFTIIGGICFGAIEIKSIFEKAESKDKAKYIELGKILAEAAKHKDATEAIEKLNEFITGEKK